MMLKRTTGGQLYGWVGVLYIDDEDDANLVKAQNVRYLESRMNNHMKGYYPGVMLIAED